MVLETEQDHAESLRCLAMIQFLRVNTICHLEVHGIEILITSTSGDNTNYWVVISRGPNHHVDELRYNYPDASPASFEEADYGSIEETQAEQPTTQSKSQCNQSEDHIPFLFTKGSGLTSLPMNTATNTTRKPASQNLLSDWYAIWF